MKKIPLLIVTLLSLVCHLPAFGATSSSYNPTPSARGISRDIYIAIRTDGRRGTGTADDPFDGSTAAKFDAAFAAAVTSSARIHLGPGTFLTTGNAPGEFRFGLSGGSYVVRGAGVGITTIKLANGTLTATSATTRKVIGQHANDVPIGQSPEYIEIGNMTIDANWQNQPTATNGHTLHLAAVSIGARQSYLHDLHAKNTYGKDLECFSVGAGPTMVPDGWVVIERVTVTDTTGWATCINAGGISMTNRVSGIVRDCTVIGQVGGTPGNGQNAYGGWLFDGFTFADNRAERVVTGFICDSYQNRNLTITGNRVYGSFGWGVVANAHGTNYDGLTITRNYFGPGGSQGFSLGSPLPTKLLIEGNQVECTAVGTTSLVTPTEINYLTGLSGNVQAQINSIGGGGLTNGATVTNINVYGTGSGSAGALVTFTNSSSASNEKKWGVNAGTSTFSLGPISDAGIHNTPFMQAYRSGTSVSGLDLTVANVFTVTAPSSSFSGNVTVLGSLIGGGAYSFFSTTNQTSFGVSGFSSPPLSTEGTAVMTNSITLTNASAKVLIDVCVQASRSVANGLIEFALFRGTNLIYVHTMHQNVSSNPNTSSFPVDDQPGTVGPHEYVLRASAASGTVYFNCGSSAGKNGTRSSIRLREKN